jgi:hypothetical protein
LSDKGSSQFVQLPNHDFVRESIQMVRLAQEEKITLRILGGLGTYIHSLHSEECLLAFTGLERLGAGMPTFADLDLIGKRKDSKQINNLFVKTLALKPNRYVNALFGDRRLIFENESQGFKIDVFLDELEYSHTVHLSEERLNLDSPTVSLADLVLGKSQIHEINNKDLIDLVILFLGHEVSDHQSPEAIDADYIAKILSEDWGFYYDATRNLTSASSLAKFFVANGKLQQNQVSTVVERIDKLLSIINAYPKTGKWKAREKTGTAKPWYQDVEEVER